MKTTPWPLAGEIHLYGLVLPNDPAELTRLGGLLSTHETRRAGVLKSDVLKRRYLAGRGLLREILGEYLGIEPKLVQLAAGEHGKPFLSDAAGKLCFNLAHSADNLLLAIASDRQVGVDIEMIDSGKPLQEMARMVFSHREQEQLSGLASPQLEETFYRYWVRKEACLKACGQGFALHASSFEVSPLEEKTGVATVRCDRQYWRIIDIGVPPGFCAALAVEAGCSTQPPPGVVRIAHRCNAAEFLLTSAVEV